MMTSFLVTKVVKMQNIVLDIDAGWILLFEVTAEGPEIIKLFVALLAQSYFVIFLPGITQLASRVAEHFKCSSISICQPYPKSTSVHFLCLIEFK